MSKSLPSRPDLAQLRKQAKDLLKSYKSGNPDAVKRFNENHPRPARSPGSHTAKLSEAQLVIAREYGFATWPKLKEQVESLLLESEDPLEQFKRAFEKNDAPLFRKLRSEEHT